MLIDLDLYGRENKDGSAVQHLDDDAISMALLSWLTSKRGDVLKYPDMGGIFDVAIFKNMTSDKVDQLKFNLKNEIFLVFNDLVELETIDIVSNYEQRYYQIDIKYQSKISRQLRTTTLYIDSRIKSETFKYESVEYVGENLENFVILNLSVMKGKILKFTIEEDSWTWGKFKLVNLTHEDPYFTRILGLINGSA